MGPSHCCLRVRQRPDGSTRSRWQTRCMSIEVIEIGDDRAWHEWYGPDLAVESDAWPDEPHLSEEALRVLHRSNEYVDRVHLVARTDDDAVVGSAEVSLSLRDNVAVAEFAISVDPHHRGRGHGRALLDAAEQLAAERGRTVFICNTFGRHATIDSRDGRFARAAGFHVARHEVRRELTLPLVPARLDQLEADSAPSAANYDLVSWWNACPDHLLAGRARLAQTLSDDEPRGELAVESQVWDEQRVRVWEASRAELGRELVCVGAIERRTSQLVAVTEIGLPLPGEDLAYQFVTVVAPEHRGHRLGILTKIANLRQLAAREGGPRRICTWNAESNREMIRVNAELGFVVIGHGINWQKVHSR
jgi:GNAT superfamily N-acetyltransferase